MTPRRNATRPALRLLSSEMRIWAFRVVGDRAEPVTPRPYLLSDGEARLIETMRRREGHPYQGSMAA